MAFLDKLLDPMDSMTRLLLINAASIEGFLQLTSSLEHSGVKPLLDGLQVPLGFWMEMWPAGHWQASPEPCGPSPLDPLPVLTTPDRGHSMMYLAILEMCDFQTSAGLHSGPELGIQSGSDLDQHFSVQFVTPFPGALDGASKGHPLPGSSLQCTKGETEAIFKETSFAKVTRQSSIFVAEIRTQNTASSPQRPAFE